MALACFAASLIGLAIVVVNSVNTGSEVGAIAPGPSGAFARPSDKALTYAGVLPPRLVDSGLVAAAAGQAPDISFEDGDGAEKIVDRIFVPVAAIGTGVDALSLAQLQAIVSGATSDWASVGGVAGKVKYVTAGPAQDQALVATFAPQPTTTPQSFPTYDELRAAMKMSSGLVAFVPLEEVRLVTMAIAIDGVDVVRGRGDASSWPFIETVPVRSGSKAGDSILASIRTTLTAQPPKVTRIVATGDILQSRCSLAAIEATGDWAAALRGPMADYLAAADLTLGSLDGSIQDVNPVYKCVAQDYPNLSSPPEVMAALTLAGFDEMTVATNHVFDCGVSPCGSAAFLQTIDRLRAAGIQTVGGGKNLDEALAPAIFEVNGVKFGVLGFDDIAAEDLEATATEPGTAPMDDSYADEKADLPHEPAFYKPADMLHTTQMETAIRNLKKQVDVVIVQLQSGYEDTHDTNPRSIKGLRAAADAGADLVIGNQGHFVQPAEVRGNTFIDYALGNFIFDQTRLEGHTEGYVLEASFWGKQLANVRMVPYQIVDKYKPTFVDGSLRAKILDDVFTASASLPK
jgi:poly-gamma-glutamate synthesis protein (capsule biosynthesis protein)